MLTMGKSKDNSMKIYSVKDKEFNEFGKVVKIIEISSSKSRSAWLENGTEKARKQRYENSKRLIKSAILGNADIFVVRKSYNTQKAQDIAYLVLFCCYILCFCCRTKSLKLTAAFWRFFEKQVLN